MANPAKWSRTRTVGVLTAIAAAFSIGRALGPNGLEARAIAFAASVAAYGCRDALQELDRRHALTVSALFNCDAQLDRCVPPTPEAPAKE